MSSQIASEACDRFDNLLRCLRTGHAIDGELAKWRSLQAELDQNNVIGPNDAETISAIANNTIVLLAGLEILEVERDEATTIFQRDLESLCARARSKGSSVLLERIGKVRSPESRRHARRDAEPIDQPTPRHLGNPASRRGPDLLWGGTGRQKSLRDWFLTHLPYPYPTYTEKRNLALQDGIPLSKIDSDLTNWRRRSGWAEIRDIYAKRSKEKMKSLLLRVQRGEDTRPDLLERIEGIRRYMDKESDKVGDWVHELASFARPEKRPKLDHASSTNTNTPHAGHRSISSVSSSSSLSDISAFATMDDQPSHAHTHDSPSTRSVSASSTLSDASIVIPSQGPKRSMSFADDEQVANKAKTSHTPLRAEPTWVDSPTEYSSSDPSCFSATLVSLGVARNSVSSLTSSSDSSLPSTEGDDGEQMVYDPAAGSASAVSHALTVTDTVMSSECSSIWSTELELPSLPHMHERSAGSWRIPTLSEFRPDIGRWVQRG